MPPVSTTPVVLMAKFVAGVVDTRGKFATSVVETCGKFAFKFNDRCGDRKRRSKEETDKE